MRESHYYNRGWGPGGNDFGGGNFPGLGESFSGPPAVVNPTVLPVQAATGTAKAGGFSLANIGEIKNVIDRMGGIEGVLATVGKVQKFMTTMQQFAPLIKIFMKKKKSSSDDTDYRPRRRRRRRSNRRSRRRISSRRATNRRRR